VQIHSNRESYAGDLAVVDRSVRSPRQRLRGLVTEILAKRSAVKPFSDDDTLAEVGLASLDMVALMLAVENEFTLEIPQSEINAEVFRSVATLADLLIRLGPAA
jgi:acyl carrier protein